jgi:hypothetical protein
MEPKREMERVSEGKMYSTNAPGVEVELQREGGL